MPRHYLIETDRKVLNIIINRPRSGNKVSSKMMREICAAKDIAFVDLYDAGANNTVVECIARATPLLVNKLPSVVEYLGLDYPLYYDSLDEAAEKAMNLHLILQAYNYLKECATRKKLSFDCFRDSFAQTEVYRSLPSPIGED